MAIRLMTFSRVTSLIAIPIKLLIDSVTRLFWVIFVAKIGNTFLRKYQMSPTIHTFRVFNFPFVSPKLVFLEFILKMHAPEVRI